VNSVKGKCAIVGIGETAVGKLPEMTSLAIQLEAIRLAIKDAGLRPADIDGVLAIQPGDDPRRSYALSVAQAAGICPSYATDLALGGATPVSMVAHAVMAISAGLCSTVVCVLGHKQATGRLGPRRGRLRDGLEDFEEPFGVLGASTIHGAVAARHMYEFGTTSEQFAAVAVAARRHASLNATLVMCRSYSPAWEQSVPYNVSMIELDEGVRMWSNVVGCSPEDVKIGDTVAIEYEDATGAISLPKFYRLS
jgi:acetyl-CoA acetyltransferase